MGIPEFDDIFKQINLNLNLCGITKGPLKFWCHIQTFALVLMLVEEFGFFYSKMSAENFLELTALAPCFGIGLLSFVKIYMIIINRVNLFELIEQLKELYQEILQDSKKINLVSGEIVRVKKLTKYYFILNAVLIAVYNFSTLVFLVVEVIQKGSFSFSLPFAIIVPFPTDTWMNWLVVYLHSITAGFICVIFYTTVDALYCNLTSQVCSHFTIISNEVEKLTPDNAHTIKEIVIRHQYILKLADKLEEIFTVINLYNVLVGSIEICALGFNLITGDWSQIPGVVLFLLSELLQIYVLSVFGENIIRESQRVGHAAFLSEWYNMPQKYKKMLLIIIVRSQKPQRLTAYKFSTISYGSFTKVCISTIQLKSLDHQYIVVVFHHPEDSLLTSRATS
ncbi:7tm odorant receptor domain-containing protein [Phthorimaea operculella]|nr:7tm odorant receptor domain-containing protein [Phthorimaea operculella]